MSLCDARMLLHLILFLVACTSFAFGSPIIYGDEVEDIRRFPYAVHMTIWHDNKQTTPSSRCGGSILSKKHILTAAHCLLGEKHSVYKVTVIAGVSKLKGLDLHRPQRRQVKSYRIHKDYKEFKIPLWGKGEFHPHDIAILWLEEDLILGPNVKVALLQLDHLKLENLNGIAMGWGWTETGVRSDTLRKTNLKILSLNECKKYFPLNKFKEGKYFCTHDEDNRSIPSRGDSGGPFIHEGHIVGVLSYGKNDEDVETTNSKLVAVYTNIYGHKNWIQDALKDKQGPTLLCSKKRSDKKYCKL